VPRIIGHRPVLNDWNKATNTGDEIESARQNPAGKVCHNNCMAARLPTFTNIIFQYTTCAGEFHDVAVVATVTDNMHS
jgi:hypothetical protein